MESYSAQPGNVFTEDDIQLWDRAVKVVAKIGSAKAFMAGSRDYIRCHEVVRIAHKLLLPHRQLVIVDGKFGGPSQARVDHSWLEFYTEHREGFKKLCVLDVYCVGRLPMVQLLDSTGADQYTLYHPGPTRRDIDERFVRVEVKRQMNGTY